MFSLVLIGAFFTVVFLIIGLYGLFFSKRVDTLTRLEKYTVDENYNTETAKLEKNNNREQINKVFGVLGNSLGKDGSFPKVRKKLSQASVLMKPEEFLGFSLISAVVIAFLFYLISKSIIIALIFLIIGFFIPNLFIEYRKSKRMAKINAQLPETLNIISNGLRAGFSFTQSIGIASNEVAGPISQEFNKVLRDNALGKPLEEALTNMSDRTDDEDLDMVITALIIQRQIGGNLAEVLDTISGTIRERVKIKGEIKTLTAQGRVSAIIISLLPFALALALSIISPGYLNILFDSLIGWIMIILGVILQLVGIFILTKLVDIKV